jgi:hypothetical protein
MDLHKAKPFQITEILSKMSKDIMKSKSNANIVVTNSIAIGNSHVVYNTPSNKFKNVFVDVDSIRFEYVRSNIDTTYTYPVNFCNKKGNLDTSKKMTNLSANTWRSNRTWGTGCTNEIKQKCNPQVSIKGEKIPSVPLPPQKFGPPKQWVSRREKKELKLNNDLTDFLLNTPYVPISYSKKPYVEPDWIEGDMFGYQDSYQFYDERLLVQSKDIKIPSDKKVVEDNIKQMQMSVDHIASRIQKLSCDSQINPNAREEMVVSLSRKLVKRTVKLETFKNSIMSLDMSFQKLSTIEEREQEEQINIMGGNLKPSFDEIKWVNDTLSCIIARQPDPLPRPFVGPNLTIFERCRVIWNKLPRSLQFCLRAMPTYVTVIFLIKACQYFVVDETIEVMGIENFIPTFIRKPYVNFNNAMEGVTGVTQKVDTIATSVSSILSFPKDVLSYLRDLILSGWNLLEQGISWLAINKFIEKIMPFIQMITTASHFAAVGTFIASLMCPNIQVMGNELQDFSLILATVSVIGILVKLLVQGSFSLDFSKDVDLVMKYVRGLPAMLLLAKGTLTLRDAVLKSLPEVVMRWLQIYIPGLYEYILFSYKDPKVIEDLDKLFQYIDDFSVVMYSSHHLAQFLELYSKLNDVYMEKYAKTQYFRKIRDRLILVGNYYQKLKYEGLIPGKRLMPTCVWVAGDSGVGKSSFISTLIKPYIDPNIAYDKQVYVFNTALQFMDNYNNQNIFVINDYMQFAGRDEEALLIAMMDGVEYPLNVASVDNKKLGIKGEVRFTSKLILITSNLTYLNSSTVITCLDAFNRRRDLLVSMQFRGNMNFIEGDPSYSWATFKLMNPILNREAAYITKDDFIRKIDHTYKYRLKVSRDRILTPIEIAEYVDVSQAPLQEIEEKFYKTEKMIEWGVYLWDKLQSVYQYVLDHPVLIGTATLTMGCLWRFYVWSVSPRLSINAIPSADNVTTKYMPRRGMIKTQSSMDNIRSILPTYEKSIYRVYTKINHNGTEIVRGVNGIIICDAFMLLPKHLFYRADSKIKDGDWLFIANPNVAINGTFNPEDLQESDLDFVLYDCSKYLSRHKNIINKFPDSQTISCVYVPAIALILDVEGERFREHDLMYKFVSSDIHYYDDTKEYVSRTLITYCSSLSYGDCGSPIISGENVLQGKIVGIHISGAASAQYAQIVTQNQLQNLLTRKPISVQSIEYERTTPELEGNGLEYLGDLKKGEIPFLNSKTSILKSAFYELLQPALTAPSVLSKFDPRNTTQVSPMIKNCGKFLVPIESFSREDERAIQAYLFRTYQSVLTKKGRILEEKEFINGFECLDRVNMHTSAGYPYVIQGLKKSDFFNFDGENYFLNDFAKLELAKLEEMIVSCEWEEQIWYTCLKDERRPLDKIKEVSTRVFTVANVMFTLLCRKHMGDFIERYMATRTQHTGCVGINPYSADWNALAAQLRKFDDYNDGDYSKFDSIVSYLGFKMFKALADDFYGNESLFRDYIIYSAQFSKMIILNQVYRKNHSNPSGFFATVILNDIYNNALIIYAWIKIIPYSQSRMDLYFANVVLKVYGDDNVFSVSKIYKIVFNSITVGKVLKEKLGVTYGSATKGGEQVANKKFEEITFLKNNFMLHTSGLYVAGLDKKVIQEIPSWTRDDLPESLEQNCNTSLRFAYFYGPKYFGCMRNIFLTRDNSLSLVTYTELDYQFMNFKGFSFGELKMINDNLNFGTCEKVYMSCNKQGICVQSNDGLRESGRVAQAVLEKGVAVANQNIQTTTASKNFMPKAKVPEDVEKISEMLRRPVVIKSFVWDVTDTSDTVLGVISLPTDYYTTTVSKKAAEAYLFMRSKMFVTFTVHGSSFHSGLLAASASYSDHNFTHNASFDFARPHVLIDPSDMSGNFTLEVPYKFYKNYFPTVSPIGLDQSMCVINLLVLVPLSAPASSQTSLQIVATCWCEDVELVVPRVSRISIMGFTLFGNTTNIVENKFGNVANSTLPINVKGDALDAAADFKFSGLDCPTNTMYPQQQVIKMIGGTANATNIGQIEKLVLYPRELNETTFSTFGTDEDEMSVAFISSRWGFEQLVTIGNTSVGVVYQNWIGPFGINGPPYTPATFNLRPVDLISMNHVFWRGSMEMMIKVVASRYVTGRVFVGVCYDGAIPSTEAELLSAYGMYIDIGGPQTEFALKMPFVSSTNWKRIYNGTNSTTLGLVWDPLDVFVGQIYIVIITPTTAPIGIPQTVSLLVLSRGGPDFQISQPSIRNTLNIDINAGDGYIPNRCVIQSLDKELVDLTISKEPTEDLGMCPTLSLRDSLRRYELYYTALQTSTISATATALPTKVFTFPPYAFTAGNSMTSTTFLGGKILPTTLDMWSRMYAGFKGGFRFKAVVSVAVSFSSNATSTLEGFLKPTFKMTCGIADNGPETNSFEGTQVTTMIVRNANALSIATGTDPFPKVATCITLQHSIGSYAVAEFETPYYHERNYFATGGQFTMPYLAYVEVEPDILFPNYFIGSTTTMNFQFTLDIYRAAADDFRLGIFVDPYYLATETRTSGGARTTVDKWAYS